MGKDYSITVAPVDRRRLEQIVRDGNSAQKHAIWARIVLTSAAGHLNGAVARRVGVSLPTVHRWLERYRLEGGDGLLRD